MSKSDYKRLGDYIREVDVRNRDLSVHKLVGLTIDKSFISSVANVIGTDLSNYKIIRKKQFACSLMQVSRDQKMPIAMFEEEEAIMSPAYPMFEVIHKDELLAEYLMMWFSRKEFDREASFYAVGGVRGSLTWDAFMDMTLPIPSIERQRAIVAQYETLTKRIALNQHMITTLETTAQTLYRKMFVGGIDPENLPEGWRMGTLSDFGQIVTGKTPSSNFPEDFGIDMPFITPGDFQTNKKYIIRSERQLSKIGYGRLKNKILPADSILVTCIGSDMGKVAVTPNCCITNQQINAIIVGNNTYTDYLFYFLSLSKKELHAMAVGSSTMPLLNKSDFEKIHIIIPHRAHLEKFADHLRPINKQLSCVLSEVDKLTQLQSLLLAKMGQ